MKKLSKRMAALSTKIEDRIYAPLEALGIIKENANAKFDETIEAHIRLGIDPKYTDQQLRTTVALPHGTGQSIKIAVITSGENVSKAKNAGADLFGEEDLVESINKGNMEFDLLIATPDMMPKVAKLGRVLGPRGLMPNPKLGTVTMDVAKAVKAAKSGEVQFRVEKSGIVHAGIGKSSFDEKSIIANINAFIKAVSIAKPSGSKGVYMKKITISSTMGPGVKIETTGVMA